MRLHRTFSSIAALVFVLAGPCVAVSATVAAGTWTSAPDEVRLTSDLDVSVWGKNAKSVRTVQLVVGAAGDATLTVTRKVVNAVGKTVAGSVTVESAAIQIGDAAPAVETREEHKVTVQKAERRMPDDPKLTWPLEGLRVGVATFTGRASEIEVRFDPADGRGSFWATLRRAAAPAAKKTTS